MLHLLYIRVNTQRLDDWRKSSLQRLNYPDAERQPKRLKHWANR